MNDVSQNVLVFAIVAVILVAFIFVIMRGGTLKEFDLQMLKGLFTFKGKADTRSNSLPQRRSSESNSLDSASRILKWLQDKLNKIDGNYVLTEATDENARIAANLYTRLQGDIIATCFFESPDYGTGDFAATIHRGSKFTRIALSSMCDEQTNLILSKRFGSFVCDASLLVIPDDVNISKIGGIFCKLEDKSYLTFIALNNQSGKGKNQGLVFCGTLAKQFYDYYNSFIP